MTTLDQDKLHAFVETAVGEFAAAESLAVAYLGARLGLYEAMRGAGAVTCADLATRTATHERYVREWLANQVAGGYVQYDPATATYTLPDEHAAVLADEDSPVFMGGIFDVIAAIWAATERLEQAFRSGDGVGWHEHDPRLYTGVERLFRPLYRHQLLSDWIPALEGVEERLRRGARVADVGCGHGASTIVMAEAFPKSRFVGTDYHDASIQVARKAAAEAGVGDRVEFATAAATELAGEDFDLICFFDCLHDMGDPVGAARAARAALADDGVLLLVEPRAADRLEDNLNPVSRLFYAGSIFLCTPSALAQEPGLGLGAQAGPTALSAVLADAGFRRIRVAAETPFNLVLEARR